MIWGAVGPPWWVDRAAVIVGGGPSLIGFDFSSIPPSAHVVGVNQSIFGISCEAGLSIDFAFVESNRLELSHFASRRELYLAVSGRRPERMPQIPGAIYLRAGADVIDGGTSGHAALQLAVLKRSRRIVLLGFDYGFEGRRSHYHDAYAGQGAGADAETWQRWAENFDVIAPMIRARGVEVINASPASRIGCFPKCSIEDALHAVA